MSESNPLTKGLNKPQKKAVLHTKGPLLILAGAGSGKTRVMTHRIANLVKNHGVRPSHILAVTFTNKAANEMKERISSLLKTPAGSANQHVLPYLGTFHAVCARILRAEAKHLGIPSSFTIFDDTDQQSLIKELMKKMGTSPEELHPRVITSIMSRAKDNLIGPKDFANTVDSPVQEIVAEIYPKYQTQLKKRGALDFGDLLFMTVKLLREHDDVLRRYQDRFEHVMVDEYQDTNHAQYLIIKKLAKKRKNIAVCGDDDQSIYAWRGATVQNILSFENDYPDAEVIKLEQNYRSTRKILDAAFYVIKNNLSRKEKRLWTDNPKGKNISKYVAETEQGEAEFVADKIEQLKESGVSPDEIAVLYRTNAQSRNFEESMIMSQIPYRIVGGFRFYQRKEIKDILAYVRLLVNPNDDQALWRAINTPTRGIGAKTVKKLRELAEIAKTTPSKIALKIHGVDAEGKSLELEREIFSHKGLKKFSKIMAEVKKKSEKLNPQEVIELIIGKTKYVKFLEEDKKEAQSRIENLDELLNAASRYGELKGEEGLHRFITDISLLEQEDSSKEATADSVSLMTLHSAKGLEFDVVFLVGFEEGLLPHSNSTASESEVEEERRLCYVGITRAKKQLFITRASRRTLYGKQFDTEPSRFLYEIPDKLIDEISEYDSTSAEPDDFQDDDFHVIAVKAGDKVKHPEFGAGTVDEIDDDTIWVVFDGDKDKKAFIAEYAKLQKI